MESAFIDCVHGEEFGNCSTCAKELLESRGFVVREPRAPLSPKEHCDSCGASWEENSAWLEFHRPGCVRTPR